tara:strand:- start:13208 stop:14218 length:1011 start_codon:yes stop_codon:yes gene_type:complete
MKFALMMDDCAIKSYYIKDGSAYDYNDNPFVYHHSVSPQCMTAMQNLPYLFDEGYFWNWSEWDNLPDVDLDLIFYDNGKIGLDNINYEKYSVSRLREKYPKAKILGWIKEVWVGQAGNYEHERYVNRLKHLNECDAIVTSGVSTQFKNIDVFNHIRKYVDKKWNFLSQPVNTEYLFDNFYSDEKELAMYAYLPNPIPRRGETYNFVNYLSKKYNVKVIHKPLQDGQKFDYLSLNDFIRLWSSCAFHFNLDPLDIFPGNQVMQVACTGGLNFGGVNESHTLLYPETATCDVKVLEDIFVECLNNDSLRFKMIEYAWEKVNEIYGFKTVKKQISDLKY